MLTFKEAKNNFFDSDLVKGKMDEGARRELSKEGAYARTVAKRSIKKARRMKTGEMSPEMAKRFAGKPAKTRPLKSSEPGQPPRSRSEKLKKGLLYAWDPQNRSAVVGPTKFGGGSDAPETLEKGGQGEVEVVQAPPRKARTISERQREAFDRLKKSGRVKARKVKKQKIKVAIKKRPYMKPTLDEVAPRMAGRFKSMISD